MARLPLVYLIILFLGLSTGVTAMGWFNERIPRRELVTPIIDFEVRLSEKSPQTRTLKFKYPGKYGAHLIIYATKANQPPRSENLADRNFSLKGVVKIKNSKGIVINSVFETTIGSKQTGAYLTSFDVDEKYIDEESTFSVSFDLDDQDVPLYFDLDKTRLYVRKELKRSIFD